MITANMTEAEILAEAEERLAYQKKYANDYYTGKYTLESNIEFVREMTAEKTKCLNDSKAYVDEYYQMFVNGIDGIKWTHVETQNFYNRIVRKSIRDYCNAKHFALPRDEHFNAENNKIGLEGMTREMAAAAAFMKYAAETGFQIRHENTFAGIPWETNMVSDLQNYKE